MPPIRMQMKPVVMAAPHRADVIGFLQHRRRQTPRLIVAAQASPAGPAPTMMASGLGHAIPRHPPGRPTSPTPRWRPRPRAGAWPTAPPRRGCCPPPSRRSRIAATARVAPAARIWRPLRSRRLMSSFFSSSPNFEVMTPTTTTLLPLGRKRSGSKPPARSESYSRK